AEVTVAALAGVQEQGGRPRAGERGGDLPRDDPGLADARHDDLPATREQDVEGQVERRAQALADRRDPGALKLEHATGALLPLGAHRPSSTRTTRASAPSWRRSPGRSSSRRLVAPSDSARSGSSCTSRKTASAPAPTAARASVATIARSPPDEAPRAPGCCTLWVASKTTGQPLSASTGSARMSDTRLLYPNAKPRSVTSRSVLPVERAFSTTRCISQG